MATTGVADSLPLLPWSHPDYPLLLPAAVAHFWSYLGHDSPAIPAGIGFLFTFSTVGLLFSALSILLAGRTPVWLGATALLATPSFIEQENRAVRRRSSVILLSRDHCAAVSFCDNRVPDNPPRDFPGLLALAGFAAASALLWTKNEGLLFLGAIWLQSQRNHPAGHLRLSTRNRIDRARSIAPLFARDRSGASVIVCFGHFIAPPGDLFPIPATTLHKLLQPARYWAVTQWYVKGFFRFGRWLLLPGSLLMIAFYFVAGGAKNAQPQPGIRTSELALALTLAGYFAVYLITPYDIYWHLRFSLTRLFLQLWPSAIFLFFLDCASTSGTHVARAPPPAAFDVGVNFDL